MRIISPFFRSAVAALICSLGVLLTPAPIAADPAVEPCGEDFDTDLVVGISDHAALCRCLTGPDSGYANPGCFGVDLERDHDVDLRDAAIQLNKLGPCHLCPAQWAADLFCIPGVSGSVRAVTTWDDGNGPSLYVGGSFSVAGCAVANSVAKWDGLKWSALGAGLEGNLRTLAAFDDGTGSALYAGGLFEFSGISAFRSVAKWNGYEWSALDAIEPAGAVHALAAYDDGNGPALYAAGQLRDAANPLLHQVVKWTGDEWVPLGAGLNGSINALLVFDDGGGPALYAGGGFTTAGGVPARHVARWNGSTWSAAGEGPHGHVQALAVVNNHGGSALYAAGGFQGVAIWAEDTWSYLGTDLINSSTALAGFDDGTGSALYVGGHFPTAEPGQHMGVARWDGAHWSTLDSTVDAPVLALGGLDMAGQPTLVIAGLFREVDSAQAVYVAGRSGDEWRSFGTGIGGPVSALAAHDSGSGEELYIAGDFSTVEGVSAKGIARWNGSTWSALGSGVDGWVSAFAVFDDGGGPCLYAGGAFGNAGGVPGTGRIARWDGTHWAAVGAGIGGYAVRDMTVFDDGAGPALYAAGEFSRADAENVHNVAKWDGKQWSALGTGTNGPVFSLGAFDDGNQQKLYAGGWFFGANGDPAHVVTWDGTAWTALSPGVDNAVMAMVVYTNPSGPALYAGGVFNSAGGLHNTTGIAQWNGVDWAPLNAGLDPSVSVLTVLDDGGGSALYVGGNFMEAGARVVNRIAKWDDGLYWTPLGTGMNGAVRGIAAFSSGNESAIYVGGQFTTAGGVASAYLGKWYRPATCDASR